MAGDGAGGVEVDADVGDGAGHLPDGGSAHRVHQ